MDITQLVELLHKGQRRRTGEKYTTHLYAVRDFLTEAGVDDEEMLQAALLHDALEESYVTKRYLAFRFGTRVAGLVHVLTKQEGWITRYWKAKVSLESLEEGLDEYPEAVIIKLADRLHNLRTLEGFTPSKQEKYLQETKDFLLPLFHKALNNEELSQYHSPLKKLLALLEEEMQSKEVSPMTS